MKFFAKAATAMSLFLLNIQAFAGGYTPPPPGGGSAVPEMDAGMAALGLGLLTGVVALIAERRRSK